jgi:hypothetical protein
MNRAIAFQEARRVKRDEVFRRTTISIDSRPAVRAIVVDISPLGCMVRCDAAAGQGMTLAVDLPGLGNVAGTVAWSIMGRIGVEFANPIAESLYEPLLEALQPL